MDGIAVGTGDWWRGGGPGRTRGAAGAGEAFWDAEGPALAAAAATLPEARLAARLACSTMRLEGRGAD